ncbi:MAG: PfkB family carbohydrate kinase [Pseudomonadota bacterium]
MAGKIICIGSVLWDVIGRASAVMRVGSDVPGRITRLPGGVMMNIAMTLRAFQMAPVLLTAIGKDPEGDELLAECRRIGLDIDHVYRSEDLPTDTYMAVEGANGLVAAIADAHSLEAAGAKILRPLTQGPIGTAQTPFQGQIVLDGNLTTALLSEIAAHPAFGAADLRIAPASPGKVERLRPLLAAPNAMFYVNKEEAGLLCQTEFEDAASAAKGLCDLGAKRVLVTDGGRQAAESGPSGLCTATPPQVLVTRVTGAGDTFMAAHIAAEASGASAQAALERGLRAAAAYVSGDVPS